MTSIDLVSLLLPAMLAVISGAIAGYMPDSATPATLMRTLTAVAGVSALSAFVIVLTLATGLLPHVDAVERLVDWCPMIPLHHRVSYPIGILSLIVLGVMGLRVRTVIRKRRWATEGTSGQRMLLLDTPEPIAYAAPGRPGCVVVSNGILQALCPQERKVLFAHERAHLEQRHDRFLLIASLAVAIVPFLRPLAEKIRLATERCADEAAVAAVGGDREIVAQAIARAAIARSEYVAEMGTGLILEDAGAVIARFSGSSVMRRVNALIGDPTGQGSVVLGSVLASTMVLFGIAVTSLQIHHLATVVIHICRL